MSPSGDSSRLSPSGGTRFKEIEHKFVVGDDFDLEAFRARMQSLGPTRTTALAVRDVYYWSERHRQVVYRHRYDHELQHLSVKSLEKDTEVRVEVNLDLGQHRGDQQPAVEAFLDTLEIAWRGEIEKQIEVYYFADCEVVYYRGASESESVACVEFEARRQDSIDDALDVLRRYEKRTGFEERRRSSKTLVELLFPEWRCSTTQGLHPGLPHAALSGSGARRAE